MLLLVGLGNPGSGYAANRHNIGFMAAEEIARRHGFGPFRRKFQGRVAEGKVAGEKVLALLPDTYMNLSGNAVGEAVGFYKLSPADVLAVHDDLDLAPGRVRLKTGGGAGGHNGLKSIDQRIGREYRRLRLGIGHPGDKARVTGHVLSDFAKADKTWLEPLLDAVSRHFPLLVEGRESDFLSLVGKDVPKPETPASPQTPASKETP